MPFQRLAAIGFFQPGAGSFGFRDSDNDPVALFRRQPDINVFDRTILEWYLQAYPSRFQRRLQFDKHHAIRANAQA